MTNVLRVSRDALKAGLLGSEDATVSRMALTSEPVSANDSVDAMVNSVVVGVQEKEQPSKDAYDDGECDYEIHGVERARARRHRHRTRGLCWSVDMCACLKYFSVARLTLTR